MSLRRWPRCRHDAVVFGSRSYPDELRDGKRGDAQASERLCSILGDVLPESLHVRELDAGGAPDTTVWQLVRLAMWPGVALTLVVYCLPEHGRRRAVAIASTEMFNVVLIATSMLPQVDV